MKKKQYEMLYKKEALIHFNMKLKNIVNLTSDFTQ